MTTSSFSVAEDGLPDPDALFLPSFLTVLHRLDPRRFPRYRKKSRLDPAHSLPSQCLQYVVEALQTEFLLRLSESSRVLGLPLGPELYRTLDREKTSWPRPRIPGDLTRIRWCRMVEWLMLAAVECERRTSSCGRTSDDCLARIVHKWRRLCSKSWYVEGGWKGIVFDVRSEDSRHAVVEAFRESFQKVHRLIWNDEYSRPASRNVHSLHSPKPRTMSRRSDSSSSVGSNTPWNFDHDHRDSTRTTTDTVTGPWSRTVRSLDWNHRSSNYFFGGDPGWTRSSNGGPWHSNADAWDRNVGGDPRTDVLLPNGDLLKPNGDLLLPNGDLLRPNGDLLLPNGDVLRPNGDLFKPNGDVLRPNGDVLLPNGEVLHPNGDVLLVNGNLLKPDGDLWKPNGDVLKPNGDVLRPNGDVLLPNGEVLHPNGDVLLANGNLLKPDGDLWKPNGDVLKPNGDVLKPNGDVLFPNGDVLKPNGNLLKFNGDVLLANGGVLKPNGVVLMADGRVLLPGGELLKPVAVPRASNYDPWGLPPDYRRTPPPPPPSRVQDVGQWDTPRYLRAANVSGAEYFRRYTNCPEPPHRGRRHVNYRGRRTENFRRNRSPFPDSRRFFYGHSRANDSANSRNCVKSRRNEPENDELSKLFQDKPFTLPEDEPLNLLEDEPLNLRDFERWSLPEEEEEEEEKEIVSRSENISGDEPAKLSENDELAKQSVADPPVDSANEPGNQHSDPPNLSEPAVHE